jgi:uncharacterized protein YcbX
MSIEVGRVKTLFRYPVKSMGGETPDQIDLLPEGMAGDRYWALRDESLGGISGAKRFPELMGFSSRLLGPDSEDGAPAAEIVFPDGRRLLTSDPEVAESISEVLGEAVTLWPLLPADQADHYRRGAPAHEDMETELRSIFGRTPDEALPDMSVFPPEVFEFASPPGTYFDAFPLHLMTSASLSTLQERAPDTVMDIRRFRPNFLIEEVGGESDFPEASWCGHRLAIGEAEIEIIAECPRCVMTTHGFDDVPKAPAVMRTLVRENAGNLGVYAKTTKAGRIRVGDPVRLISDSD